LHCPAGVLEHLDGLNARDFVKKPAAAGVHEKGMPLHLKQLENPDLFLT
jgi:hypothetical protein